MSQGGYRRGALRETAMNFDFGVAQKLMAGDVRPRLFFGPDDIPQLRQALATPMGKRFWRRFREKCDYLAVLASKASPAELVGSLANDVLWEFCSLAVYALLTEDERALVACRHILTNVHAMDKVVADKGRGHLGYGFARFFAQGYDIVAPFLSADERRQFCDWGTRRVIKDILPEGCKTKT